MSQRPPSLHRSTGFEGVLTRSRKSPCISELWRSQSVVILSYMTWQEPWSREPDGCQLEELVTKSQPGPPDHAFLPLPCFSSAWYRFPAKLCTGFYVCLFSLEAALMGRAWARTLPLSIESTRKGEDAHLPPV